MEKNKSLTKAQMLKYYLSSLKKWLEIEQDIAACAAGDERMLRKRKRITFMKKYWQSCGICKVHLDRTKIRQGHWKDICAACPMLSKYKVCAVNDVEWWTANGCIESLNDSPAVTALKIADARKKWRVAARNAGKVTNAIRKEIRWIEKNI